MTTKNQRLFELVQPTWDHVKKGMQHRLTLHLLDAARPNLDATSTNYYLGYGCVEVRVNSGLVVSYIYCDPDDSEASGWYVGEMARQMRYGAWTGQYEEAPQGDCEGLASVIEAILGFAVRQLVDEFDEFDAANAAAQ